MHNILQVLFKLQENLELLQCDPSSEAWLAYVDYIDEMIVDGFFTIVQCNLKFLLENTTESSDVAPLFEAVLELQVGRNHFKVGLRQILDKICLAKLSNHTSIFNSILYLMKYIRMINMNNKIYLQINFYVYFKLVIFNQTD